MSAGYGGAMIKYLLVLIMSTFVLKLSTACDINSSAMSVTNEIDLSNHAISEMDIYRCSVNDADTIPTYRFIVSIPDSIYNIDIWKYIWKFVWKPMSKRVPCTLYVFTIDTTDWYQKKMTYRDCPKRRFGCLALHWKNVWMPRTKISIVNQYEVDCGLDESWFPIKLKENRWMGLK